MRKINFKKNVSAKTATATVAAAAIIFSGAGVAFAYWTGSGTGAGAATAASTVASVVVSQTASTGTLAPGVSVALNGLLTNSNNTDIKVGSLTAAITGVSNGAAVGDFTITGGPVLVNTVVKKGTPQAWSGLTLNYANSAVNQDNGKGATVSISYTLTPFVEPPAGPSLGTVTYVNSVLTIQNVGLWPTSTGNMTVLPGDKLVVRVPANGWNSASDVVIVTAGADATFNFTSVGGYYTLAPGPVALQRGTTFFPRSPVMLIG